MTCRTRPGQVLGRGNPVSYLFAGQGTQHCIVLEFSATSQAINHALIEWVAHPGEAVRRDRTDDRRRRSAGRVQSGADAGGPPAVAEPFGYGFDQQGTQHVVYRGADNNGTSDPRTVVEPVRLASRAADAADWCAANRE